MSALAVTAVGRADETFGVKRVEGIRIHHNIAEEEPA